MAKKTEYCGRCSMTTVVDAVGEEDEERDPFAGERIELDDDQLRTVSPAAWFSGVARKLDELGTKLTYRR